MHKTYGVLLSATKDIFLEEVWKQIETDVKANSDTLFFFCGKPLYSTYRNERYENTVYSLARRLDIDGLIVKTGTLMQYSKLDEIENYIERFGSIPKVSVSYPLKNCSNILLDNYESSRKIAKLLLDLKCKTVSYVSGPEDNMESSECLRGFQDELSYSDVVIESIYRGNFTKLSGERAALQMLEEMKNIPEVIVCANDEMALGVFEILDSKGVKVPGQVKLIGFDDIQRAKLNKVPLTTLNQPFSDMLNLAYTELENDVQNDVNVTGKLIIRETSGLNDKLMNVENEYQQKKKYIAKYIDSVDNFNLMLTMQAFFENIVSMDDLKLNLQKFFREVHLGEVYIMLFDDFKRPCEDPNEFTFPDEMNCFFGFNNGQVLDNERFPVVDIYPKIATTGDVSATKMVFSLNFNEDIYGYIVCDDIIARTMMFTALRSNLINILNRFDTNEKIRQYTIELEEASYKDSLTKVFNRRGFRKYSDEMFSDENLVTNRPVILYCDLDRLKYINDKFGHASGDYVINEAAKFLSQRYPNGIVGRVGGDEFVVCIPESHIDVKNEVSEFQQAVITYNNELGLEYDFSLSIGVSVYSDQHNSIEKMMQQADIDLYTRKKSRIR